MPIRKLALAALAVAACAAASGADISLAAARVGAKDVAATARFYQAAFGLKEVQRLNVGPNIEIMMNFGASTEAARANPAAQVIVMHRDEDSDADPVPHIIFTVADVRATLKAVVAAGGKAQGEPIAFGPMVIGFGTDPAGNRFELLQPAAAK